MLLETPYDLTLVENSCQKTSDLMYIQSTLYIQFTLSLKEIRQHNKWLVLYLVCYQSDKNMSNTPSDLLHIQSIVSVREMQPTQYAHP